MQLGPHLVGLLHSLTRRYSTRRAKAGGDKNHSFVLPTPRHFVTREKNDFCERCRVQWPFGSLASISLA